MFVVCGAGVPGMSSAEEEEFQRRMGRDLLVGGHYDIEAQASSVQLTSGEVIVQPGETRFGFHNPLNEPIRLVVTKGKIEIRRMKD